MPYLGGKSSVSTRIGAWIVSHLPPPHYDQLYVEPFGGMFGIGLKRSPAGAEWLNDIDELVVNWWRMVRDRPEELSHLLEFTPWSEQEFKRAWDERFDDDPLRRALNVSILLAQSISSTIDTGGSGWSHKYGGQGGRRGHYYLRIRSLARRMYNVQLFCRDVAEILEKTCEHAHALIYCDPPYFSTQSAKSYRINEFDVDKMTDLLQRQAGSVAVSGYAGEWDHLGWRCEDFQTITTVGTREENQNKEPRTERLWMNYDPVSRRLI